MSYSLLAEKFTSSKTLSQKGRWVTVDVGREDGPQPEFLLGRMGSTNYKWAEMAAQNFRENKSRIEAGTLPAEESRLRAITVFCHTVLFNWRHIDDEVGEPMVYTPEEGIKTLAKMDRLYDILLDEAQSDDKYLEHQIKEKVGNSEGI